MLETFFVGCLIGLGMAVLVIILLIVGAVKKSRDKKPPLTK